MRYYLILFFCLLSLVAHGKEIPFTAKSWLVADETGKIIEGKSTNEVRAIGSITKLMTVMIVLDSHQSLDEIILKKLYNQKLSRGQLIDLALVKSDNASAKMLCENYIHGYNSCIEAMNTKAKQLGMNYTFFTDPTGLLETNISTAEDLIKLVNEASKYKPIVDASNKPTIKLETGKKFIEFHNTNSLVGKGYEFIVTKTGLISKSGGCIVFMLKTEIGKKIVVLLGSKNGKTRIPEAQLLASLY
jgi:serine-type D-Ala-D-Ala endopeptidase (penicillin-binding protein 7)